MSFNVCSVPAELAFSLAPAEPRPAPGVAAPRRALFPRPAAPSLISAAPPAIATPASPAPAPRPAARATAIAPRRDEYRQLFASCEAELHLIQRRLGTADELPNDLETARKVAHRLKNLRFALNLCEELLGQLPTTSRAPFGA